MSRIEGILSGTTVIVGNSDAKSMFSQKGFGEQSGSVWALSLIEALFLVENGDMSVIKKGTPMEFTDLLKEGESIEKGFYAKYKVYSDLRKRGILARTGLKFGTDFRYYEKGADISKSHSTALVHVIPEEYTCSFPELVRMVRLASGVKKKMVYAIVDGEGDITYYSIERTKI